MDPLLKQRLVGTLVLVALGVVFWPLIFVTAGSFVRRLFYDFGKPRLRAIIFRQEVGVKC